MTAFHASGGDVLWQTTRLSSDDTAWLLSLYRTEYCLAMRAKDMRSATAAIDLHTNLADAMTEQRRWAKASGGVR